MADDPRMNPQDRAVLLLAQGRSSLEVGKDLGVSDSTVRTWRWRDPEFEAKVQRARQELLDAAVGALAAGAKKAVATLLDELDGEQPAVRVRAALGLLAQIPPLADHVLLERKVAALEAETGEGER